MADLVPTQALPQIGGRIRRYTAGVNVAAGNTLCRDNTLPYAAAVNLADANASDPAKARVIGIAVNTALAGAPVDVLWLGDVDLGVACAKGTIFVLSGTAGKIAPATVTDLITGMYTSILGVGKGGNLLRVNLNNSEQLIP